jgi:hypothetical protein
MLTPKDYFELGVDPYWQFAMSREFLGFGVSQGKFVPLIAEFSDEEKAQEFILEFEKNDEKFGFCARFDKSKFVSIYVDRNVVLKNELAVLKCLTDAARWEFSAPFESTTATDYTRNFLYTSPLRVNGVWNLDLKRNQTNSDTKSVVAFIDYGCAFANRKFRKIDNNGNPSLETRVRAIWDQGAVHSERAVAISEGKLPLSWCLPVGESYGMEATRSLPTFDGTDTKTKFNQFSAIKKIALGLPQDYEWRLIPLLPSLGGVKSPLGLNDYIKQFSYRGIVDEEACYSNSGYSAIAAPYTHGTHIMDIATGYPNPLPVKDNKADRAEQDIIFVQLPRFFDGTQVFGLLKTYVLDAVRYIFSKTDADGALTINLSYGSNCGPHNGDSILECALDEMIESRRNGQSDEPKKQVPTNIIIPAGNSFARNTHAYSSIKADGNSSIGWTNTPDNPTYQFIEIWIDDDYAFEATLRFTPPGDKKTGPWIAVDQTVQVKKSDRVLATVIAQKKVPQSLKGRMILIAVEPTVNADHYGEWSIEIKAGKQPISVNAWCERDDPVFGSSSAPRQGEFTSHVAKDYTLNSIAHGKNTVVVGGQNPKGKVADYSSEGSMRVSASDGSSYVAQPERGSNNSKAPIIYALSEESDFLTGLSAAGVLGDTVIRLPGTSVATAVATRYISQNPAFLVPVLAQEKQKPASDRQTNSKVKAVKTSVALAPNDIMQQAVSQVNDSGEATGSGRNSAAAAVIPFDVSSELTA